MKIKDVKTFQLKVTVKEPFTSSRGWWYDTKGALIVKIEPTKGLTDGESVMDRLRWRRRLLTAYSSLRSSERTLLMSR